MSGSGPMFDLEERIAFLGSLWEEVRDLDEFTESEKISIQTELHLCEEKLTCMQQAASTQAEQADQTAEVRQALLDRIFNTAPKSVHDLMSIFLTEQARLESKSD